MSELPPFVPKEFETATGNFGQDLADSVKNHDVMVAEARASKEAAYQQDSDIIAQTAVELENQEFSARGMDVLKIEYMRIELVKALNTALDHITESPEGRQIHDAIYEYSTGGSAHQDISTKTMAAHIRGHIIPGISTATDVISAFWRMIQDHIPQGEDFFAIANAPESMSTLVKMTRAWHLGELRDKNGELGATFDDYGGGGPFNPNMTSKFFTFTDEGVGLSDEGQEFFQSGDDAQKVMCPAGHGGRAVVDGKEQRFIPVKRIAKVFLQKAQDTL